MGVRRKSEITEAKIQKCLRSGFLSPNTKKYEMFNLFVYDGWESDYLAITNSNYVYECEIKISRTDFFNDFKHKQEKHLMLEGKEQQGPIPNYFYYAVPEGLVTEDEVPEYAGLIYVYDYGQVRIIKQAPKLKNGPSNIDELNLINKFYYSYWNWRDKYERDSIEELKKRIKALEKDIAEYDDMLSVANSEIDELKHKIEKSEK